VQAVGPGGLYLQHLLPLFAHLRARGLRPMIWADMCLSHPEILDQVPSRRGHGGLDYSTASGDRIPAFASGAGPGHRSRQRLFSIGQRFRNMTTRFSDTILARMRGCADGKRRDVPRVLHVDGAARQGFRRAHRSANRCWGDMPGIPLHSVHVPNCFFSPARGFRDGLGNLSRLGLFAMATRGCQPATYARSPPGAVLTASTTKRVPVLR